MKTTPRIAIDARMVHKSGIGTCIQHWLKDVGYSIALGDPKELEEYKDCFQTQIPFISSIYGYKEQLKFPYRKLKKSAPDVLHVPHCNIPLLYRGKMMATIHDLTHLVYPEFLPMKLVHWYFKFIFWFVCKRADRINVVSESTKKDLLRFYKVNPDKITVTPLGVGKEFVKKSKPEIEYLYEKYSIPRDKKIILYVGNLLPHKNLNGLLKGFAQMKDREDCRIVMVGKAFDGRTTQTIESELGIEHLLIRAGMVSQEDLVNFYNLADLFVLPSLYEGFGLPILEAFACGTPVACSNTSSMPEVGGQLATYFDPQNPESIAHALEQSIHRKGTQDAEIEAWVSRFSWENCSRKIREIAESLCAEK
ncbi:glycosyltransferase family 1 protein [Fibrobacter sp. UWEL]|uniref:glycosyltransferase family 4 protein n=1 Tax=Fibrobacter sp. UWEL TaxID=1896209 RepID=UPI00091137FE|nr:glycosyltransferase family 1 protein [Fibrobacter sp. UWEL]SHK69432.1 Glycosyltransferase involved in cell wall bisynthesis [Fibrobacter sp. UWEL]